MLRESERILREKPYLFDARVVPRRLCGDTLDVDVVARDVWTLLPDADFSRSGGDNAYGYGVTDTNCWAPDTRCRCSTRRMRTGKVTALYFLNPNVAGTRVVFETLYEDNSDGSRRVVDIGQPFYSLDARHALGVRAEDTEAEQSLYAFSDKFARFSHDFRGVELGGGISNGEIKGQVWRWLAGFNYEKNTFGAIPDRVAPDPLPADRKLAYPWIGIESIEDRFDTSVDIDRIHRTEDLNFGRSYRATLGYSNAFFGGDDDDRLVFRATFRDGIRHLDKHLLFYGLGLRGYWNFSANRSEQVKANAFAQYRQQQSGRFSLAAAVDVDVVHNLPTDMQLLGGGDTGLRGYPSRYQWGNRSWLASIEERYFSDVYLARIVRVGLAGFFDVGRTWFSGAPDSHGYGTLADVGFGFRFESTRTRQDRVLHVDFAFPLVDGPDVQSMQILLVVKERL